MRLSLSSLLSIPGSETEESHSIWPVRPVLHPPGHPSESRSRRRSAGAFLMMPGRLKLLLHGIFAESKHKDHGCGLSRAKPDGQVMAAHGSPPVRDAVAALSFHNSLRRSRASVKTDKIIPAGVKSGKIPVDRKDSIVIPSLPVFRLVIDPAAADLHLSCGEIALEIGRVILRVPQAELRSEEIVNLFAVTFIGESQPVDLTVARPPARKLPALQPADPSPM